MSKALNDKLHAENLLLKSENAALKTQLKTQAKELEQVRVNYDRLRHGKIGKTYSTLRLTFDGYGVVAP